MGLEFDKLPDGEPDNRPINKRFRSVDPDLNRNMKEDSRSPPKTLMMNALAEEGDRGCVLVGCAFIEYATEKLLRAHFQKVAIDPARWLDKQLDKVFRGDEKRNALLGTGWAKTEMALLLGLVDRATAQLCDEIRILRNNCAHYPGEVSLNSKVLKDLMRLFRKNEKWREDLEYWDLEAAKGEYWEWGIKQKNGEFTRARCQFMSVCRSIYVDLCIKIHDVMELPPERRGMMLGANIGFSEFMSRLKTDPPPPETPPTATPE
jgi:hypothetical protein